MSCITELMTQIKDLKVIGRIAKKHNHELIMKKATIEGSGNNSVDAYLDIKGNHGYAVGFRKEDKEYIMVADMYGVSSADRTFVNQLKQEYGVEIAKQKLREQGFNVTNEKVLGDGSIEINLSKS